MNKFFNHCSCGLYIVLNPVIMIWFGLNFIIDFLYIFAMILRLINILGDMLYLNNCWVNISDMIMYQTFFCGAGTLISIIIFVQGNIKKDQMCIVSLQFLFSFILICFSHLANHYTKNNYDLVNVEIGEEKECTICLEQIKVIGVMTKCNHVYHKECIDKWLTEYRGSCPNCRNEI